jgi:hypothetical protein
MCSELSGLGAKGPRACSCSSFEVRCSCSLFLFLFSVSWLLAIGYWLLLLRWRRRGEGGYEQRNPAPRLAPALGRCFRWSFASASTPGAGCVSFGIHGLNEGARGTKSSCGFFFASGNGARHEKACLAVGLLSAALSPDRPALQIRPLESMPAARHRTERPGSRHRLHVGYQCRQHQPTGLHLRRWQALATSCG